MTTEKTETEKYSNLEDLSNFLILPGREHISEYGTYKYPDLDVMCKLRYNQIIKERADSLKLLIAKNNGYVTNLNKFQFEELLTGLNDLFMLSLRQGIDLLELLKYDKVVYDGNGKRINRRVIDSALDELMRFGNSRGVVFDTVFSYDQGKRYVTYKKIKNGGNLYSVTEELETFITQKYSKVKLSGCNRQGLPTEIGEDLGYYAPRLVEETVAVLWADNNGADIVCLDNPKKSYLMLGVIAARIKK